MNFDNIRPLRESIKFIEAAQNDVGEPYKCHMKIEGGFIRATNGLITIGCKTEIDFNACPHTGKFSAILKNPIGCGFEIKKTDAKRLCFNTKEFKAFIPCLPDMSLIPNIEPDKMVGVMNDTIKTSFATVAPIALDSSDRPMLFSVLLHDGSCFATNDRVIIQHYHGIHTPRLLIPKRSAQIVAAANKKLIGFGFSDNSVTFWFEDESFIKAQLSIDENKEITTHLKYEFEPVKVNDDIFKGLSHVLPFATEGFVYLGPEWIRSHAPDNESGCEFKLTGPDRVYKYNSNDLNSIEKYTDYIYFGDRMTYFFSGNTRGIICHRVQ